jgi:hypothetical protein
VTQAFATHDAERYSSFTTEIVFSSSYIALLRFLSGLQNAPEIHTINNISIVHSTQKDAAEGDLEIALSISTFSIINN